MEVLDHLVFSFGFTFAKPQDQNRYATVLEQLPRPLVDGTLLLDENAMTLAFTIDAPDRALQVRVEQTYLQLTLVKPLFFVRC
ncbi:hypothetical protein [Flagellimonas allohymeniacidonis]|uniref:Uncharacterized protein n=1 Tax=Flagellimonas allohymeniacidonis TaxID=2517819 RepID=A0A4Q8QFZ8_9FLAO|nr:hypothetical protein [Allomuricauda hymeniacidonis]TAI47036.1 hypothetical protein EW142_10095 [Allomuricauda hymeniacidonis]